MAMHSLSLAAALLVAMAATVMGVREAPRVERRPPIDLGRGYWGSWRSWSACTRECGGGTRTRSRTCIVRYPLPRPGPLPELLASSDVRARAVRALPRPSKILPYYCYAGQRQTRSEKCNTQSCSGGSGDIITRPTNCKCPRYHRPGTSMVTCPCVRFDVGAVVDGSGSISPSEFADMREALRALLNDLRVSRSGDHVSLVVYSTSVAQAFSLTGSRSLLDSRVNSLSHPRSLTRTDLGISRMSDLILPGRNRVPKIGVVFTDGRSTNKAATLRAAQDAKACGVTLFAVGIGDHIDQSELDGIASSSGTVLRANSYSNLRSSVVHTLARKMNSMATS